MPSFRNGQITQQKVRWWRIVGQNVRRTSAEPPMTESLVPSASASDAMLNEASSLQCKQALICTRRERPESRPYSSHTRGAWMCGCFGLRGMPVISAAWLANQRFCPLGARRTFKLLRNPRRTSRRGSHSVGQAGTAGPTSSSLGTAGSRCEVTTS